MAQGLGGIFSAQVDAIGSGSGDPTIVLARVGAGQTLFDDLSLQTTSVVHETQSVLALTIGLSLVGATGTMRRPRVLVRNRPLAGNRAMGARP